MFSSTINHSLASLVTYFNACNMLKDKLEYFILFYSVQRMNDTITNES